MLLKFKYCTLVKILNNNNYCYIITNEKYKIAPCRNRGNKKNTRKKSYEHGKPSYQKLTTN